MRMATMKELRAECAALGITPGRSIAECERRIAEHRESIAKRKAGIRKLYGRDLDKPPMSRTMRMLADTTAVCGTLARNPLIYGGDPDRHDYATVTGYLVAVAVQVRRAWQMRQPWPTPRRFV